MEVCLREAGFACVTSYSDFDQSAEAPATDMLLYECDI